ncbi:PaaI family thioesterase [Fictibacillus sp. WQ 8-8]|uniref:PaaI family thioesterase n=1 Tax=Fictibacillus sp. WQ 8-8 TaxID=2938788 RepID=UPI00210A094C|nr:PaaI family thioesterase [Fictibacillus sp. WQ 8-8]MCQ6268380.1 PaaI family thioesterase [Fictibacillus sp. WQ 8-8]
MNEQKIIQEIKESLDEFNQQELQQIQHTIHSIKASKEGGLYFLGRLLGIDVTNTDHVTMDLGMQNANTYGVAQGGAVYTLADVALGYKIISEASEAGKVFTIELKVNYVKQGKGSKLYAHPVILHNGKNTVVGQCTVTDDENNLVAVALGTFFMMKPA